MKGIQRWRVVALVLVLGGALYLAFRESGDEARPAVAPSASPPLADPREADRLPERAAEAEASAPLPGSDRVRDSGERPRQEAAAAPPVRRRDLEEIKAELYERQIDSVDRLYLLDDLVQTGDADTREFWADGWGGVDDWKRTSNGFHLEAAGDGALIFIPDEETIRTYSFFENIEPYHYDEERGEFVSEVDYYGKKISNVLKFLDEDVLVMMTISGSKVDLNVYGRGAAQE